MSEQNLQPEFNTDPREWDEPQFDVEALRARRRQYALTAAAVALAVAAALAIPWRDHVQASGRIAPQRWASVHSEAPGVVREVTRRIGEAVEPGEVIAVLDSDEQSDALEAARLALAGERQKLTDLELRLRDNAIQREGADAVVRFTGARAVAAERVDGSRIAALDPIADMALAGVRRFATEVRATISMNRNAQPDTVFRGEELYREVRAAMERYAERAAVVADHLARAGGADVGRQFRSEMEDLNFSYALADHSMEEILTKHEFVSRGIIAPVVLRELGIELEREAMELAHGFRALSASARNLLGSRAEQSERVRGAEETRRLLANESDRLEAQRASVTSEIAAAELAVRAAERHQGKTAIRAPIGGVLAGDSLARFDAITANTAVGVVEDIDRLVLKLRVADADLSRVKVGQAAQSRASDGRVLRGEVTWTTPVAGQEVRDQAWNVLIQLAPDSAGVEVGEKVEATIDVGRRSMMARWLAPSKEVLTGPRVAFVEDPTQLREIPGALSVPGAAEHERMAAERPGVRSGAGAL
ncbi:MAG: HlyD family secretion protein [Steroidobacteraceae bacterium]